MIAIGGAMPSKKTLDDRMRELGMFDRTREEREADLQAAFALCHRCLYELHPTQAWRVSNAGYKVHANLDECDITGRAEREEVLNA